MKRIISLIFVFVFVFGTIAPQKALASYEADQSNYSSLKESPSVSSSTKATKEAPKVAISTTNSFNASLSTSKTYPGEAIIITVTGIPSGQKISVESKFDFTPNFFETSSGIYKALFPINYRTAVGDYTINITSGEESQALNISIQDKKFQIQNLKVDNSVASQTVNNQDANNQFEKNISPLRPIASSNAYFKNLPFVWPVGSSARVTTEFGMIRYVNGSPTSSRHGGIDFAVPLGTNVKSTNSGKVLYSGFLQLTGNTVVIEHGYGLKSWYYHMNSLNVKTNELVTAGQIIGTVGSTGFSSGPHLHFAMSVNNVYTNPTTIINKDILSAI